MRAALIREFGDPDVIKVTDVAPPPIEGTRVVRVTASPVIDLDTKLRTVEIPEFGLNPPYVPGGAVVGTLMTTTDAGIPGATGSPPAPSPMPRAARQSSLPSLPTRSSRCRLSWTTPRPPLFCWTESLPSCS